MYSTYFGIDSHLKTTTICALTPDDVTSHDLASDYQALAAKPIP